MTWVKAFGPRRLARDDEPEEPEHALSGNTSDLLHAIRSQGRHDLYPILADAMEEGDNAAGEETLHLLRNHPKPQNLSVFEHTPGKLIAADLSRMKQQYKETALWSSTDESDEQGGEPMDDNYDANDIHPHSHEAMDHDVDGFVAGLEPHLREAVLNNPEQAGHDFWLTRNGHGVGFRDRGPDEYTAHNPETGEEDDVSRELHAAAITHGNTYLYVGDDGMIHSQ